MSFLEQISDQLNLRWAWEKVRHASAPGDVWIDEIELAGFELELERNLQAIADDLRKGRYRLNPLRPMAFPKNPDKKGIQRVRQYFHITVRDQVAWTAVVNVLGPHVDKKMPSWSYGNRLFRSIWVDTDEDGTRRRKIGRYRHASGRIYLPFGQGWPIFRRHVFLTTSAMTSAGGRKDLPREDQEELELQERLEEDQRCPFVLKEYWANRNRENVNPKLFWCSIDLEKFYPSIKLDVICQNIVEHLPPSYKAEASTLLKSMFIFPLDLSEWSNESLKKIDLRPGSKRFHHIPTGLFVSGFLANAGLLKVDLEVSELLKNRNIAHFRYVDDHIILAYNFSDLVGWVEQYAKMLASAKTGARVNPEKVEPEELADFFIAKKRKSTGAGFASTRNKAEVSCELDPKFPAPLMTKTLALVSAIAQTDMNLLEESELESLTDQLEHLLLVEIPETEIPERTRLAFAATRLASLAECRLANPVGLTELTGKLEKLREEIADKGLSVDRRTSLGRAISEVEREISEQRVKLNWEMRRTFSLIQKVLRERPDRVRLWTRAIQICRLTGVNGLSDIFEEIRNVQHSNTLAAEYLTANSLALLGTQAMIAANIICDKESAEWRQRASLAFLHDICSTVINRPPNCEKSKPLRVSWLQFCVGIYCANFIIKANKESSNTASLVFPDTVLAVGGACIKNQDATNDASSWAWWAARASLKKLSPRADDLVNELGHNLKNSAKAVSFWRFFPADVPGDILKKMAEKPHPSGEAMWEGWWYDALSARKELLDAELVNIGGRVIARVQRNILKNRDTNWISLYDWCNHVQKLSSEGVVDPRASEWTALEIVRQIAHKMAQPDSFDRGYILSSRNHISHDICLHPANFRVPKEWLGTFDPITWEKWRHITRGKIQIDFVLKGQRINDRRYTPIHEGSSLFLTVNQVRGLGLLLYGLLGKSFALPAVWNGPGHSDVLNLLPALLLRDMTCSSLTLGVLLGCLQPRATENLFNKNNSAFDFYLDDDTLHDPISFVSPSKVRDAVSVSQQVLEKNQLSTLNHKARQLTPISIRQLTLPDWGKSFANMPVGGGGDE